jgi:hypothetical protein
MALAALITDAAKPVAAMMEHHLIAVVPRELARPAQMVSVQLQEIHHAQPT